MARTIRLLITLALALSMLMVSAGAALAFDPPGPMCWDPPDFPGAVGQGNVDGPGAWQAHFKSNGVVTNILCSP